MKSLFDLPGSLLLFVLTTFIRLYRRLVSPAMPNVCRFYPSCSAYGLEALEVHGPWKGSWLMVRRLVRCHPAHPGGIDYVPPLGDV